MSEISDVKEIPEGDFPINLRLIQRHQWAEPSLTAKNKGGKYQKGYFREGSNKNLSLITHEDKIVITSKIQGYVLHWYHTYLLHP